jgi:tRNA (guanine-N7-)-methyltransferase
MSEKDQNNKTSALRSIRSFVRREGRITARQQQALEILWPQFGVEFKEEEIDFKTLFGREGPVVLEIGFGMGQSLLTLASQNLDNNYLGIEVHRPGVGALLQGLMDQNLKNVRVLMADAKEVLVLQIPDQSLDALLLFFPDPWPKKRHHKRRLVQPDFLELVAQKLKKGGYLHMATDWENYAEQMLALASASKAFDNAAGVGLYTPRPQSRPLTKFERRGQKLGHGVWDLLFIKR